MAIDAQDNTMLPEIKEKPEVDIFSPNYIPPQFKPLVPLHDNTGRISDSTLSLLAGDAGQRMGITAARDEGAIRELGKGVKAGLTDWAAGTAGTLGAIDTQASLNALSDANQHWRASDRKQGISWAANLIGHTTGFNAPNLAAMIATGYATGGSSIAMKAASFATTYLSMKDTNDRELARRLPEVSFSDRQSLSFGLTVAQAVIEQGFGANKATANAVSKMLVAKALKDQGAAAVKKGMLSRVLGKIPMLGGRFGRKVAGVQGGETIEEMLQEGLIDASVATGRMIMGKDPDMTPAQLYQKYKQLGIDTFVGSLGLGVWGGTLNYIADHRANVMATQVLDEIKGNKELVDSNGVQEKTPDGKVRYVVDPIKQARTFDYMNIVSQALGFGEINTDPMKRSSRQTLLMNLAYNLAATEIRTDPSKAALVTPEKYFKGLRVAVLKDETAAAKLSSVLERNGTLSEIVNAINEIAPETGKLISDVHENYKYVQLKRQVDDYGREISSKVASDSDMIEASRVARSVLSTGISLQVRDIAAGKEGAKRQVRQEAMDVLIDRMTPESFRKVYAKGRIDGVKVGKDVVSIRLKIIDGEMTGEIMTESEVEADTMLEEKAIAEEGKEATAELTTNISEEYAKLKLKNLEYTRAKERYDKFDNYRRKDKAQVAEDAKEMEKESQEDRDARQADMVERARMIHRLLANIKEEMDLMPVEDAVARKQSGKFLARYGKKKKTAEGKPKKMEINEERIQEDAVSGTLEEELGKVEPKILEVIEAMSNRRKAQRYHRLLAPKRMVQFVAGERKGGGFTGAYIKEGQLIALFEGHDIGTVIHEIVHHLVENALMPTDIDKILRHNFAVGTDKETKMLNIAEKEAISDSFLLYLRDAVLPEDSQTAKAFRFIKAALSSYVRPFKQRYVDETGAIKAGAMDMKLNEATKKILESLFSETTQDKLADIYGKALGESLMLGDISDPIFLNDLESINNGIEELARRKGMTQEAMNNELQSKYAEVFGNKTSLEQLDDIQRAQFYNILKKEMNEYEHGWKSKNETDRILFERQGVASDIADKPLPPSAEEYVASIQGELPAAAAILLTDGRVLDGKSHMAILQASMKMKGIGYAAEGAVTNKRRFVSRHEAGVLSGIENPDSWTSALIGKVQPDQAKVDKAAIEFYEKKRLNPNFDRPYVMAEKRSKPLKDIAEVAVDRKKLNSYIMWNLLDADKEAETRYTMQEFGKDGISRLSDGEAEIMARDLQAAKEQERQQAKTKEQIIPAETTGMTKELGGKYVNQYERGERVSKLGVLIGRRSLNWTTTLPALIDIITDRKENSSWKSNVLDVLSKVANDADTIKNDFYKEWHDAGFTPQSTRFIYDSTDVDKITLNNSAMLFIYLMSNLGKDFQNQSMKKFMVANPEFNDEKLLSKIVKIVADDKRYAPIVEAMQKYNDRYFDIAAEKKADVIEKATGKRVKPKKINRAYTPERTKGDLYIEGDEVIDQLIVPYAGGNIGLEPSEFMHRGALPKGEYNMDAFGNFFSHIERLIDYSAKVDAVYKVLSILENNKMRDAFIQTYGDDTYRQAIIKHVQRFMSPRGTLQIMGNTPFAKSVSNLNRMAYPAFLSWNIITTPVTQLTTVFPAVSALGIRAVPNFIGNIGRVMSEIAMNKFDITKTSFYKLASEVSPSSFNDLFPIAEREGVKMLLEYGAEALNGRLRGPLYEGLIKFRQKGMKPMAFTDMFVRLATYKTAFDMKYNELSNAVMNDDVRINKARVFAEEVIRKSHNPSSILDKTLMQTEASPFIKSVLAFTSQPQAMMNVMITDVYLPLLSAFQKSGVIGVGKEIVGNKAIWRKLAFGALLPGLALGAIARRRPQRDLEEVLSDSFVMGLASVVPVVGQGLWLSAVLGWGESGRDFSGIYGRFMKDTTAALSDVIQGEFDVSTLKSARRSMTLILGVPDAPIRVLEKLFEGKGAAESLLGKAAD